MACRSLSGVAFKTYTVEISYIARILSSGRHEEHLWLKDERKLRQNVWRASPRPMLLSARACGNNLFSGSTRRDSGMMSDCNYNSRTSGVCGATTSSQGVSANKVLLLLHSSFILQSHEWDLSEDEAWYFKYLTTFPSPFEGNVVLVRNGSIISSVCYEHFGLTRTKIHICSLCFLETLISGVGISCARRRILAKVHGERNNYELGYPMMSKWFAWDSNLSF